AVHRAVVAGHGLAPMNGTGGRSCSGRGLYFGGKKPQHAEEQQSGTQHRKGGNKGTYSRRFSPSAAACYCPTNPAKAHIISLGLFLFDYFLASIDQTNTSTS